MQIPPALLGYVTRVTDTNWVARNATGSSIGHAATLTEAKSLIERGVPMRLRWTRDAGSAGVERWTAYEPK